MRGRKRILLIVVSIIGILSVYVATKTTFFTNLFDNNTLTLQIIVDILILCGAFIIALIYKK